MRTARLFALALLLAPHLACSRAELDLPGDLALPDADAVTIPSTSGAASDGGAPEAACSDDLTVDPHNCGACGHDCLGATCAASLCTAATLSAGEVVAVAVDDVGVYWSELTTHAIVTLPNGESTPATVATVPSSDVPELLYALDGTLYWGARDNFSLAVSSVPTSARNAAPTLVSDTPFPCATGLDIQGVRFAPFDGNLYVGCNGLWKVPAASGNPSALLPSAPIGSDSDLVIDPSGTWIFTGTPSTSLTTDGEGTIVRVALGTNAGGPVVDYPVGGTNTTPISGALAIDAHALYWIQDPPCAVCAPGITIQTWPLAGGAMSTFAATLPGVTDSPSFSWIAVNGTSLFAVGAPPPHHASQGVVIPNALYELPLDGRPPFLLAVPTQTIAAIAVDATYVYFIDGGELPGLYPASFLRRVPR